MTGGSREHRSPLILACSEHSCARGESCVGILEGEIDVALAGLQDKNK